VGYAIVLLIMMTAFSIALVNRSTFEVDVLRERGELSHLNSAGQIVNQYSLRVLNKTQQPQSYTLVIDSDLPLEIERESQLADELSILPGERLDLPLTLFTVREAITLMSTPVTVALCESDSERCVTAETRFFGPSR
jgi:polyferredoxin